MNQPLKLAAGLLLIPLFAVSLLIALALTFTLVKDAIESKGDFAAFEGNVRHYTDTIETGPDGSFIFRRASHPVATLFAAFAVSWAVVLLIGYTLERLRPYRT
jgi:hypothetical protein